MNYSQEVKRAVFRMLQFCDTFDIKNPDEKLRVSQLVKMSFVEMRRDLQVEGYERVWIFLES